MTLMRLHLLAALMVASLAACLPAAAQDYGPRHYRAVAMVCQWEFDRYCHAVQPDSRRGLHCLAQHFDQLSVPCGRTLKAAAVIDACRPDHRRLCPYVFPGGGRVLACLQSNADRLSQACARTLDLAMSRARPSHGQYDENLDQRGAPIK